MIIFSKINPKHFVDYNTIYGKWSAIEVYNLNSYLMGYTQFRLFPQVGDISDYALLHPDSNEFEAEYTNYLLGPVFKSFLTVALAEYRDSTKLYLFLIDDTMTTDAMVETLCHNFSIRYGFTPMMIENPGDIYPGFANQPSSFSVVGLANINADEMMILQTSLVGDPNQILNQEERCQNLRVDHD